MARQYMTVTMSHMKLTVSKTICPSQNVLYVVWAERLDNINDIATIENRIKISWVSL